MTKRIVNFATTGSNNWKELCLDWAKSNQPFRVYGIEKIHLKFCEELCLLEDYRFKFDNDSTATFAPADFE
jgi:hypothetical protein